MIRIVIAEGSLPVRESLAGLLATERDFEVVGTAAHGWEAVDMTKRLAPDVVVMDSRLPVIDGIEATRLIKGLRSEHRRGDAQRLRQSH